jgi:tRNA(Leu) C34 or U34 (ribose-2'-O)-methylase TrmL
MFVSTTFFLFSFRCDSAVVVVVSVSNVFLAFSLLIFLFYPFPSISHSHSHSFFFLTRVILALDEVHDPQNLGALLRSSYYLGCSKVIITTKNSSPLSPIVSKASSGAMEIMDIRSVSNMMSFLENAKSEGWTIIGTDIPTAGKTVKMEDIPKDKPKILVLGNEGYGVRKNVIKKCDYVVSIDSYRTADSNASLPSEQHGYESEDEGEEQNSRIVEGSEEQGSKEVGQIPLTPVEEKVVSPELSDKKTGEVPLEQIEKRRKEHLFASLVDSLNVSVTGGILLHYFLSTFTKKTDSAECSTGSTIPIPSSESVPVPDSSPVIPPSKWIVY